MTSTRNRPYSIPLSKTIPILLLALFSAATSAAKIPKPDSISFHAGNVAQKNRENLYNLSAYPKFTIGAAYAVVGANLYFDRELRLRDDGNDILVLDAVGYRKQNFEASYSDIEGLTLGRGFIVRNYYSNTTNNVPVNEQKGIVINRWTDRAGLGVFGTLSHLYGGRAERRMGRVEAGTTLVGDSDPDFKVWGLDAAYTPRDQIQFYAETAQIEHYGAGAAAGVKTTPFDGAKLMIEFRRFDADFVPGIVDEHYEARPVFDTIANNPSGRIDGYLTQLLLFENTNFPVTVSYEDYEATDPRLTFGADVNATEKIKFRLFFAQQNFTSRSTLDENSVIKGELLLGIAKHLTLIVDYYRAYDDARTPLESIGFQTKIHR